MQVTPGFVISGGVVILPRDPSLNVISGDPALALGTQVAWTSNTYFYTAGASTIGISGGDHQYDTNNMVWQVFYAHQEIRLPVGSNRWGPISRTGGANAVELQGIVAPNTNNKTNWAPNVETRVRNTVSINYAPNVLNENSITTQITIPANRYFLLGISNGPFYKNYRKTANNITAVNGGNPVFTVLNEVYVGPWPTGPLSGIPNQLGGNAASYFKFAGNLYYSAFKFEVV
jgi:hypothetical protein